jgi:O-antigen ligase/polysaccharide polymerase Wzy-like membrane protein
VTAMKYHSARKPLMNILVITLLFVTMFASYLGSWLPPVGGSPAGGVIRDGLTVAFMAVSLLVILFSERIDILQFVLLSLWALLACWLMVLIVTGGNVGAAILGARNILMFPLIGVLLLLNMVKGNITYVPIKRSLYVVGFIAAMLGVLDFLSNGKIPALLGYRPEYRGEGATALITAYLGIQRASGGLADSLNYGYTMALFTIYVLYHLLADGQRSAGRLRKFFLSTTILLGGFATIFSLTRGAIIVLLLGMTILLLRHGSWKVHVCYAALLVSLFVVLLASDYSKVFFGRFLEQDTASAESSRMRVVMAENSLRELRSEPFGVGLGSQGAGAHLLSSDERISTDNYFLWVALESGIPGLCILMSALFVNFLICFRKLSWRKSAFTLFLVLAATFGISGMLSSAPISPIFAVCFWMIVNSEAARTIIERTKPGRVTT